MYKSNNPVKHGEGSEASNQTNSKKMHRLVSHPTSPPPKSINGSKQPSSQVKVNTKRKNPISQNINTGKKTKKTYDRDLVLKTPQQAYRRACGFSSTAIMQVFGYIDNLDIAEFQKNQLQKIIGYPDYGGVPRSSDISLHRVISKTELAVLYKELVEWRDDNDYSFMYQVDLVSDGHTFSEDKPEIQIAKLRGQLSRGFEGYERHSIKMRSKRKRSGPLNVYCKIEFQPLSLKGFPHPDGETISMHAHAIVWCGHKLNRKLFKKGFPKFKAKYLKHSIRIKLFGEKGNITNNDLLRAVSYLNKLPTKMATYSMSNERVSARKRRMRNDLLLRMFEIHSHINFKQLIISLGRGDQIKDAVIAAAAAHSRAFKVPKHDKVLSSDLSGFWREVWEALEQDTYLSPRIK